MNVFTDLDRPLVHRPGDAPPPLPKPAPRPRPAPNVLPVVENPWSLTPMECEVMRRVILLQTGKEIGAAMNRSPKTIEIHHERLKAKMKAKNLMHAALLWDRHFRGAV
jgi:DNA-binding CsgD family transcriptional regulator